VFTEATAVEARGRISPEDAGIYLDSHVASWSRCQFIRSQGAVAGMQLHMQPQGSTSAPGSRQKKCRWKRADGTRRAEWIAFADDYPMPRALAPNEINETVRSVS